jgi:4-hydroxybenzoate polyprenyltransferase
MVIHAWNRMLRLPNLAMIILIQVLIYATMIKPHFLDEELVLSVIQSILFLFSLLCVAASGYVINNIYDAEMDSLNEKTALIPIHFSKKFSWGLYAGILIAGLICAVIVAYSTQYFNSLFLYPLYAFALWLYSYKLKCFPLIGNILIAFLTASVIAIIAYAFWDNLIELRRQDYNSWAELMYKIVMLFLFAVLSNLAREVVKDIEDFDADASVKCNSTAKYFGVQTSKFIALNIWLALLIICGSAIWYVEGLLPVLWCILILGIPAICIFILLIQGSETNDFAKLSLYMKLYMVVGTIYWCLVG